MNLKKTLAWVLCLILLISTTACGTAPAETPDPTVQATVAATPTQAQPAETQPETEPVDDGTIGLNVTSSNEGDPLPMRVLSVEEMVAEMGTGWNLGNTLDGHSGMTPNETLWQDVETTQALIDAVHDLGFNTVRVPITWGTMINDDYSINEKWINRVQDIVDYCIRQDMYVIINIHHDGADQAGWIRLATDDLEGMYEKFAGVWSSIAVCFRDYDEHLIFESMNEVYGEDTTVEYDTQIIMNLNQIFVNVVRSSGGNNGQRWLSVPGRYTNTEHMTNEKYGFDLPEDTVEDRIFAAVHYYDWSFGMEESMTKTVFDEAKVQAIANDMAKLVTRFTSQGIPVILGEYGAINKNNPEQRAYHNEVFNLLAKQSGVVPVYWDQGWYDRTMEPADYSFTLVDRKSCTPIEKEVTDGLMRGFFAYGADTDVTSLVVCPEIIPISDVTLTEDTLALVVGDIAYPEYAVSPENTNDVLLWKSENPGVATVYNGMIRARGIGTAVITAFSQSGSVAKTITVTVAPIAADAVCTINAAPEYTLEEGKHLPINASFSGGNSGVYLTYDSCDPGIVTVNAFGKLVGIAPGNTEVIITATDGASITVPVTVTEKPVGAGITLALNVLYNDNELSYFGNEIGEIITIYGDGQYTLTFDCSQHLSSNATDLGITGINHLTAIYIKDYGVTSGEIKKSNLISCEIRWDKIVVDGVELTITNSEFKSAIKASGILDTNDPFNSWDGSAVEEVSVDSHVLNINMENPQTVTITFTIRNLQFAE